MSVIADRIYQKYKRATAALGFVVRTSVTSVLTSDPTISAGAGAPSAAEPDGSLYFRTGGAADTSLYVRISGAWVAVPTSGTGAALAALLASTANGEGASLIGIEDAGGLIAATDTEGALAENRTAIDAVEAQVGVTVLANLTTTDKTGLQPAINEVDGNADAAAAAAAAAQGELDAITDGILVVQIAVGDVGSGATDGTLTLSATRASDGADPTTARQLWLRGSTTQYHPNVLSNTTTFGAATTGSVIASGNGWALVQTDAAGDFACPVSNSADETVYFSAAPPPAGVSSLAAGVVGVISNSDPATWS